MKTYGYYIVGVSGNVKIQHCVENHKTVREAEKQIAKYVRTFKVKETGYVIFSYTGDINRKYDQMSYKVLERSNNTKAFFEYWD